MKGLAWLYLAAVIYRVLGVARNRVLVEKAGNVLGDMGLLSKAKVGVGVETKTYWLAIPSL